MSDLRDPSELGEPGDLGDAVLRELGKELPWERPDAARRDAVRSSLLIAAAEGEPQRARRDRRWLGVGAAFAAGALAAAVAALVLLPEDRGVSRPAGAARITASEGARLEHGMVATRAGVDEIVRVRGGSVRVAVAEVRAGDRVQVRTGDAEVEGRGEYDVSVAEDALAGVVVRAGTAEIRLRGQRPIFLAAGQTWRASIATAELPLEAAVRSPAEPPAPAPVPPPVSPPVSPPVRNADRLPPPPPPPAPDPAPQALAPTIEPPAPPPTAPPAARGPSETERRFQVGWALLRAGKSREAAIELAAAAEADERDPLAADARYFQAVALARAGAGRDAERVLARFLDGAPRSLRRGRASVLLAQLLAARGDTAAARTWFRSAAADADPAVAAAARAGLAQLGAPP